MIVLEVSGKYIRWGVLLQNIYSYNIYITYVLVSVILIVLIFFFVRCFGKKKECKEEDIKEVLKVIDKLLEKLPEKELNKFSKTKDAELYKSVLRKYGIR